MSGLLIGIKRMPYCTIFRFVVLLGILMTTLSEESWSNDVRKYKFRHLDLALESMRTESIVQDRHGYIWIGTLNGLHRFDGTNLKAYLSTSESTTLNSDHIEYLFEDSRGRLWIATDKGCHRFNHEFEEFREYPIQLDFVSPEDPRPARTQSFIEDEYGVVWISNERAGLQYFDEETESFRAYFLETDEHSFLRHVSVLNSVYDAEGHIWIGTRQNGLIKIDRETKDIVQLLSDPEDPNSLKTNEVEHLCLDDKRRLWVSTYEHGLSRIDLRSPEKGFVHYEHDPSDEYSLYNNDVLDIVEDREGNIWICNENGGLHLYNEERDGFYRLTADAHDQWSLSSISIKTIFQDSQGRLWVGTHLNGVDLYDSQLSQFHLYKGQSSMIGTLSNDVVRGFHEGKNGSIWIATDGGGLNHFDRSSNIFKVYRHQEKNPNCIKSDAVLTIEEDRFGRLWIGTWQGGINILNRESGLFTGVKKGGAFTTRVFCIYKDGKDRMWVGDQRHGLSLFDRDGNFIQNFRNKPNDPESISGNSVVTITEDHKGRIWVGTEYAGLNRIETNKNGEIYFVRYHYYPDDSVAIPNRKINHLFEDDELNLWIATDGGGLSKYSAVTDSFYNYRVSDGLPSNSVKSVTQDDQGNLWIGTSKGISRFDPKTGKFTNYSHFDGLQKGSFSRYAVLKLSSGELVFGGYSGFNIFHPEQLRTNPYPPIMKITNLKIMNQSAKIGKDNSPLTKNVGFMDEIILSYDQSMLTLEFVGISYVQPDRNQYSFRLLGFDDSWNNIGNLRQASFTNLDPGTYTFQVKGANNDGVWSEENADLVIIINPPWWATSIFRIILGFSIVALILGFVKWRTHRLQTERTNLENLVNERTLQIQELNRELEQYNHELFRNNDQLLRQKEELESMVNQLSEAKNRLAISEKMASIGVFTAGIAHEINNPVNFISGAALKLKDLLKQEMEKSSNSDSTYGKTVLELIEIIKEGVSRTTKIIRSLRTYVQADTDLFVDSNIVTCLEDAIVLLSHKVSKKISIKKNTPESVMLKCMPGKINQIFVNLISNAVDAIDGEGVISIDVVQEKCNVLIKIADNGPGIEEEKVPKLFDPFYTTKEVGEGTGLGLYLVYGIVKQHKGSIQVSSEVGQGTVFTISLPIQD